MLFRVVVRDLKGMKWQGGLQVQRPWGRSGCLHNGSCIVLQTLVRILAFILSIVKRWFLSPRAVL